MLSFATTWWQAIGNSIFLILGLFISLSIGRFVKISILSSIILYIWHTIISIYYYYSSLENPADSVDYYIKSLNYSGGFAFGTKGIFYLTSIFSETLDMSYGGVFLVFNIFGSVGLLAMAGALVEIVPERQLLFKRLAIAVLFLPGVSFWSSAIGKDSLAFMAAGLAVWASLQLNRRYPAMLIALCIFLLIRPHIGGIASIALALATIFTLRSGLVAKAALLAVAMPAAAAGIWFGLDYAGISDPAGMSDITDYMEDRQGYNMGGGSSIDIVSMSWPMRLFSYLFRPLPLESPGLLGLVVGLENMALLAIFIFFSLKVLREKSWLPLFPRAFMLLFAIGTLIILANTTANLGIAIRQKWMFVPMLICVAFSYARTRSPASRSDELAYA